MTLNDNKKNNSMPLVSVVVPVFNVEKYVKKCIDSILNQTYTNFEVIIIDDGSPDASGKIADALSKNDNRIKVIHIVNSGVSFARNVGIENSRGDYITFVDADDYLANDYLEYMVGLVYSTKAELCISLNCYTKKNEKQVDTDNIRIMDNIESTSLLLSPRIIVGCWNKLYNRKFLIENNIMFKPELFYGEGLQFITTSSQRTNMCVVGEKKVYYYRRNNSFSATTKFNINSIINGEKSIDIIEKDLLFDDLKVKNMLLLHRCMYYVGALTKLSINKKVKENKNDYLRWKRYLKSHLMYILRCKDIPLYRKLLILCTCISPAIMGELDVLRRKKISHNSV
ncbi:MAG: glycosyltransferase family 2 protein [Lachnospiraceae bacterium]|nr:glycosyltransferase family 2 protein [Lachnospiraceae bacterium]